MLPRKAGQTLTEYGLIGGSLAVVCIAALSQLGGNIASVTTHVIPPPQHLSLTAQPQAQDTVPMTGSVSSINNANPQFKELAIPQNLPAFIQVAGANGTTALFSNQFRNMGEHMLAKGEITEEQANYFYELANQGNRIATIEKLIEDAMKNGRDTVLFEGRTYTPYELSSRVGWPEEPSSYYTMRIDTANDAMNRAPDNRSETMQTFLSSYQKLEQSGGLNNPTIQKNVSALSAKISYLSEMVQANVSDQYWGVTTTPLDSYIASHTSYWSASQICDTGKGKTVGITCQ